MHTCSLIQGVDVEDAVGIDVEGDLNLGHTAGGGGDAGEVELSQQVVVLCAGPLALVHLDGDGRLVVAVCAECLQERFVSTYLLWTNSLFPGQRGSQVTSYP